MSLDADKKVLLITYYWPPSGGAGVQRWLKLSKYLAEIDVECHVVTVDEHKSSYPSLDHSLEKDIHPSVNVHKTDSFEITNLYKRLVGKDGVPTAGFSNVDNTSWKQRLATKIRSNFFIPDPRIGWNKYAYKKAIEVITQNKIKTVITTSPPHSTQMVGLKLKEKGYVTKWIADLRDPWTDIYYYPLLLHSKRSHAINLSKEKAVLENADQLLTVSEGLVQGFQTKTKQNITERFSLLPNGYDPADFKESMNDADEIFVMTYTGTMADIYRPQVLFSSIKEVFLQANVAYLLKIVGSVSFEIKELIDELELNVKYIDTVPHSEITKYQQEADLLLLVIPETKHSKGILTGKLFEYLAAGKPILCLGPEDGDAAAIITECRSGKTFNRDKGGDISAYIRDLLGGAELFNRNTAEVEKYSRARQAEAIKEMIV